MSEERIVNKISKLLARANDDRGNADERETAMRQAYALLAKHNLTVEDIGDGNTEKREELRVELSVYPWARSIAYSIAQLFFCAYYYQRGHNGKLATHSFVGKTSNAVTASEMSVYIVRNVFRELRARFGSETSPQARSFATGVEHTLRVRCEALRRQAEQEQEQATQAAKEAAEEVPADIAGMLPAPAQPQPSAGRALVLASVYRSEATANDEWIAANVGELKAGKDRTKAAGGSAYREGRQHGEKIGLHKQIGKADRKALT